MKFRASDKYAPALDRDRTLRTVTIAGVLATLLMWSVPSSAIVVTLGDQDFADGSFPVGVAGFNGPSAGEPAPFDAFRGSDFGASFSESWTFGYAAGAVTSASISLGLFDHDSAAPGSQVSAFSVDGVDLTALLDAALEATGGTQNEDNVYSIVLPAATFGVLSDGSATFSLTLQGPGLAGAAGATGSTTSGNGAGIDFSTLSLNEVTVAEPTSVALLGLSLAAMGFGVRRRSR